MKKYSRKGWRFILLLAIGLAGCQTVVVPPVPAAPEVWRVQVSPALRLLGPSFNQCIQQLPGKALLYDEQPAAAMDPSKADFSISLEPVIAASYMAILGHSDLAVVVNPANPMTQISQASLEAIFSGRILAWADLAKTDCPACGSSNLKAIQPYVYAPGDDAGKVFQGLFPGASSRVANGLLAPDPGAVRQAVAADLNSIGVIPAMWLDSSLKALTISDPPAAGLQFPLVLSASAEPTGARLSWLLCLQDKLH